MSAGMAAGAGLGIVGGELSGWAAYLAKQEMFRQYWQELQRQAAYRQQALTQHGQRVDEVRGAQGQMDAAKQARLAEYAKLANAPMSVSQSTPGPSQRDRAFADLIGQAKAKLAAYGDYLMKQGLSQQAAQRAIGQIVNFAGGTSSVYPYRMYEAQHSQDALAQTGAAMSSLGSTISPMFSGGGGPGGQVRPGSAGSGISMAYNPQQGVYYDYLTGRTIQPGSGMSYPGVTI